MANNMIENAKEYINGCIDRCREDNHEGFMVDDFVTDFNHPISNPFIVSDDEIDKAINFIENFDEFISDTLKDERSDENSDSFMEDLIYYYSKFFSWELKSVKRHEGEEITDEILDEIQKEVNSL